MSENWKNDRVEGEMQAAERANMAKSAKAMKLKLASENKEKWYEIYDKCKNCTSSPSMTKGVIEWFIDNGYEVPIQKYK